MNAELLLKHFHQLGDAADAVPRLRRFILDLAVRGKLVDQDPNDEPVSSLLKKITKEKAAYQTGRKKEFSAEPLSEDEMRFSLPPSWGWARTNDVTVYVQRGKSPKYSLEKKIPVIAQKCIQWVGFQLEKAQFIEPSTLTAYGEERHVQDGDLLWNSTGHGSLGRLIVFKEHYKGDYPIIVADSHVTVIRPSKYIDPDYLFCWFAGPLVQDEINDKSTGTTNQTELPVGTVLSYAIPIPPSTEQKRIVAKVDELMALCDQLEAAQKEREERRGRLTAASWQALTTSGTKQETAFALKQLPQLTARPQQIAALRQTILDLAVRGKLVKQDPKDEPAEVLLKRIDAEREHMLRSKKIRRHESLGPVAADILPFNIPASWKWRYLGDVCFLITDGAHHTPQYLEAGVPFLSVKDVSSGIINFSSTRYISHAAHGELCKRCMPELGDILLTKVGTTGIAVLIDVEREFSIFVSLALLKFSQLNLDGRYLKHLINSPFVKQQSADNTQGIGNKNLVLRLINRFTVPIPPLAEQKRIVAKVDELMQLCDGLEATLQQGVELQGKALEALLQMEAAVPGNEGIKELQDAGKLVRQAEKKRARDRVV